MHMPEGRATINPRESPPFRSAIPFLDSNNEQAESMIPLAPVAQLDRAFGYEPKGRTFESCRAHYLQPRLVELATHLATHEL